MSQLSSLCASSPPNPRQNDVAAALRELRRPSDAACGLAGRPLLTAEQVALGRRLVAEGASVRDAARALRCHHATLSQALAPSAEYHFIGASARSDR